MNQIELPASLHCAGKIATINYHLVKFLCRVIDMTNADLFACIYNFIRKAHVETYGTLNILKVHACPL